MSLLTSLLPSHPGAPDYRPLDKYNLDTSTFIGYNAHIASKDRAYQLLSDLERDPTQYRDFPAAAERLERIETVYEEKLASIEEDLARQRQLDILGIDHSKKRTAKDKLAPLQHKKEYDQMDKGMSYPYYMALLNPSKIPKGTIDIARGVMKGRNFRHIRHLGNGMYSVVRLFKSPTGKDCAVKIFHDKAYAKKEAEALIKLDHRNIVKILFYYKDSNEIIMEFIEGESILSYLGKDKENIRKIHSVFRQLLEGLEYLHKKGIVHRDIKPDNILVTPDGTVKIYDLNLCGDIGGYVDCRGSPLFMAPEVGLQFVDKLTGKSDLWSAGAVLHLILSGEYPLKATSPAHLVYQWGQKLHRSPTSKFAATEPELTGVEWPELEIETIPPALKAFTRTLLSPSPADRPSSAQALRLPFMQLQPTSGNAAGST